jgi:CDP-glucose 4,6-dehydratase
MAKWRGAVEKTINKSFWKNRKVFITGHTGFKGSWLSLWLTSLGARVTGYSNSLRTSPNLFDQAGVCKDINSIEGDVRDLNKLLLEMQNAQPEIVIHMAAQSLVKASFKDPIGTYETNVLGTVNLLEAVNKSSKIRAVIIVTSDKCYEMKNMKHYYVETDPLGGDDPYSSSKACAELVAAAYHHSFMNNPKGTRIATVRAGNVIGGGDWAKNRLLPDAIRSIANGTPAVIRQPNSIRPWQFILEPLRGYLMLAEKLCGDNPDAHTGSWNFGPDKTEVLSVKNLCENLTCISNGSIIFHIEENHKSLESPTLLLESRKSKDQLNWQPVLNIEEALCWTYDWYKTNQTPGINMNSFTLNQIKLYSKIAAG